MIVDNNEEITTGNDGTEMCSSGADVAVEMCSPESHDTYRDDCSFAKERYLEIPEFTHFVEFFSFNKIGENHKEKVLVREVKVVVALDLGAWNTINPEYESE